MARIAEVLILLLLCGHSARAAPEPALRLALEGTQVELGQPLRGAVISDPSAPPPTREDLRSLEGDFEVQVRDGPEPLANGAHRLPFRLYARHTGEILLSGPGAPVAVTVTDANVRSEPLRVRHQLSSATPWVRQQVLLTMEVITPEPHASLRLDPPSLPGVEVVPLPPSSEPVQTAAGPRTRLRAGWALFPLAPGAYRLDLPPVHYRLDGGTRRLFPLGPVELAVRPLPPYVPPTMPVGRVALASRLEPAGLLHKDHLAHWHLTVSAPAVPAPWLPPVLRALKSGPALRYLPAQSVLETSPDGSGVHALAEHTVPFRPLADGRLALPQLEVQYFDPDSGRLERVVHVPPRPLVLGIPARWAAVALVATLLAWALPRLWHRGRARWQSRVARRAALAELSRAADAAALRGALRRYLAATGAPANLPLERLQGCLPPELLARLTAASYGSAQEVDLPALRNSLLRALRVRGSC